jgi:hypothetical protein
MSWAFERARYGRRARSVPSRFLFEAATEKLPDGWTGAEAMTAQHEEPGPAGAKRKRRKTKRPTTSRRR